MRKVRITLIKKGFDGNRPYFGPEGTAITCCTDGFRPVTFKVERIDEV